MPHFLELPFQIEYMLCQGKWREASTFWPEDQGTLLE